jgi:hypothetical protein
MSSTTSVRSVGVVLNSDGQIVVIPTYTQT